MIASDHSLPNDGDVAVIGAGIAGLTAAALLAKAGLHTLVFEADPQPGGYLNPFQRKGFTFDTSIQWLNQCRPGGFLYRIHHYLGEDCPPCPPLQRIHRYKGTNTDYLLTSDPLQMRNRLIQDFPHDTQGILAFFRDAEKLGKHMRFLDDHMRAVSTMSLRESTRHGIAMIRWVWPIRRFASTPATQGLTRYFRARELLDLFHSEGTLMSVLVPIGFAFTGDFQKPPRGGCGVMVDWLCRKIAADGGRLYLGQRVKEVQVNRHKEATGVWLESGQAVQARYVVAACDVETLFGKMVPSACIPERWRKRLRKADLFYSSFNIYLGLDCDPAALGLNEEMVRLTDETLPLSARVGGQAGATAITVLSPSLRDASLAPPGKGTLIIQCPAYLNYENNWRTGPGFERGDAYRRLKQNYADILLERVERALIPDLRRHIEIMEVATPVTFWRYTGNRGGTIMGHKPTRKNIQAGLARIATPIERLLLGGQWAEYGGGVPMATKAAVNASLMILKDLRPPAFQSLKEVVDGTAMAPLTLA